MMIKIAIAILVSTLIGTELSAGELPTGPRLGRHARPAQIAAWQISVMPDGSGLPAGQGSVGQGKIVYVEQCQTCHGPAGQGASADQLAGAGMALTDAWPEKTIGSYWPYATTLFDFNRRSMPMQTPGSLSDDEVYAVTAYLLYLNGIIAEEAVLNAKSLANIRMPNRDGFIDVYEMDKNQDKP